jgi:serine/threonine protein phosphatase PrpC
VDLQHDDPRPGDTYVLCSDGLSGMVSDGDIQLIVTSAENVSAACMRLIERANERGGEDNITAVLIKIEDAGILRPAASTPKGAQDAHRSSANGAEG